MDGLRDSVPPRILDTCRGARLVVEVGAGRRFDAAIAFSRVATKVRVTDVDARVLEAPAPLEAVVDDVTEPSVVHYEGARLLYAVRPPEELQAPLARLARHVGASLALRPLSGELVDLNDIVGPARLLDGWRLHDGRSPPDETN